MGLRNDFARRAEGQGFIAPFTMLIVGIFFLFQTPKVNELDYYSGELKYNKHFQNIQVLGEEPKFVFGTKKEKELVLPMLDGATYAKIWVRQNDKRYKNIKQIELDGEMVIQYSFLREISMSLFLIIVGAVLIPFVIKAKRQAIRWRKEEAEKKDDG